ncbi:MAG: hypothetical protein SFV54_27910 [Bryobacteraceae bacterium]|nr:hypothetical protein [Bryobacteraceae bacterium]
MLLALALLIVGLSILAYALRTVASIPDARCSVEWLAGFRASRYAAMDRLLDDSEFAFLIERGLPREAVRAFRARRRQVFRAYLSQLRRDFGRLHHLGRTMVLHSAVDRPDLAKALMAQSTRFRLALLKVQFALVLDAAGIRSAHAKELVAAMDALRMVLADPAATPAAARA